MKDERRRNERLEANLFIQFLNLVNDNPVGRGVVTDVSLGGLAVETEADLVVGKSYFCDVEVPMRFHVKVVRSLTPGQMKRYGLRLIGQGVIDKFILRKLLKGRRLTSKV